MSLQEKIEELEADLRAYAENAARRAAAIYEEAASLAGMAAEPLLVVEDGRIALFRAKGDSEAYEVLKRAMEAACARYGCIYDLEAELEGGSAVYYAYVRLCI